VLLDAWVPGALGGTGHRLPLEWLIDFAPPLPWWLAGGIAAATARAALGQLRPDGLDASSALEVSPGLKDLQRVRDLLAVVRAARQDQGA
ncbi:MAG: phosphoribosylanthranilate isomerase, partial [Cyanobacteriota bacterium]|nr:phosphoribosylanthranilate isomerase [Cyanobacteriota bacterium]